MRTVYWSLSCLAMSRGLLPETSIQVLGAEHESDVDGDVDGVEDGFFESLG